MGADFFCRLLDAMVPPPHDVRYVTILLLHGDAGMAEDPSARAPSDAGVPASVSTRKHAMAHTEASG